MRACGFLPFAFCALASPVAVLRAQEGGSAWVGQNAIPMASIAIAEDDAFEDLAPLADAIGDARVVMLGEQTHGDGAAFLAKTRLIAFLHERMGFDVLCFESGIYECASAWRSIEAGADAREAMSRAVFPIWMGSAQFAPLVDYVGRRAGTDRPLELAGYDCQLTGAASAEIPAYLRAGLEAAGLEARVPAVLAAFERLSTGKPERADIAALRGAARALDAAAPEAQLLDSLAGQVEHELRSSDQEHSLGERFNGRDAQGGRNLIWLARQRYPDRKIIVWAASMHCLRDHPALETGPDLDYEGLRSAGHVAAETLGEEVYVIACTAGGGRAGIAWTEPWDVPPAPEGSFEQLCEAAGLENAIVPLRGAADDAPVREAMWARPLGNAPMRGIWPRHVDAFVYQRTMTPSTTYRTEAEQQAALALIESLSAAAARYRQRAAAGNVWAHKGGFELQWHEWSEVAQPDAATRATMERRVRDWGEPHLDDPAVGFRVRALFGHMAVERGDFDAGIAAADAALTAYGVREHVDPKRHSGYQHLVNQRALATWERDGFATAVAWIAKRVESDPALRYVHPEPWLERMSRAERRAFADAVLAAYDARIARDSDVELQALRDDVAEQLADRR